MRKPEEVLTVAGQRQFSAAIFNIEAGIDFLLSQDDSLQMSQCAVEILYQMYEVLKELKRVEVT